MSDLSAWTPRPWLERRALEGRYARLEPLDAAAHGDELFDAGSGPDAATLWQYLWDGPYSDRSTFETWLTFATSGDDPLFLAVRDKTSGRIEGRLAFLRIDRANGVVETGHILFGPRLARTRAATEAIYLQARHVFDDLGYRRFEWKCDNANEPSKRAALRFGFAFEGVFRQHMVVKGRNRDTAWFAMLDHEWPARKMAFERWLSPGNFDDAGRQRIGLGALNVGALEARDVQLRRGTLADDDELAALQNAAYAPNRTLLGVEPLPLLIDRSAVLGRYEVWLLEREAGLVAALILDPAPDHVLVWSIATAPHAQRQGLGTSLLAAAETRARQLGLRTMRLYTGEKLAGNVRWYHRHGYTIERTEELDDRRVVHMVKQLDDPRRSGE